MITTPSRIAEGPGEREPSFVDFYELSFGLAYRAALSVCRDHEVALDAAQEACVKAFVRWQRLASQDWAPLWLARVAANEAKRMSRRRQTPVAELTRAEGAADLDLSIDIVRELKRLPRRQREAAVLYYVLDSSIEDAAKAMGCSPGAVKAHLSRARARLSLVLRSLDGGANA